MHYAVKPLVLQALAHGHARARLHTSVWVRA